MDLLQADELLDNVNRYIEHLEREDEGQFWPIVQKVKIFLPSADVLESGALLVDLPGSGDLNIARSHTSDEVFQ